MNGMTDRAREVQAFAGKQLSPDAACDYTDSEQWKQMQLHLSRALAELERAEGRTANEEGELVLALLMGYCVTVRNAANLQRALARAERVLPRLTDAVLKCKLAVYCYMEFPDEGLAAMAWALLEEVKRLGREEEIRQAECLFRALM